MILLHLRAGCAITRRADGLERYGARTIQDAGVAQG